MKSGLLRHLPGFQYSRIYWGWEGVPDPYPLDNSNLLNSRGKFTKNRHGTPLANLIILRHPTYPQSLEMFSGSTNV